MPVYIDDYNARFRRMIMCHMIADSLEELHEMAARIGMKKEWFQPKSFPHYDVCKARKAVALGLGAVEVTDRKEMVRIMRRFREKLKGD